MITQERRSHEDRRKIITPPLFPLFDCQQTLVRQDRRQLPDRRINNIHVENAGLKAAQDFEETGNHGSRPDLKRLFVWFQDEVREVNRENEGFWMGRAQDCLARFNSKFISRQHARLCYQAGNYYLVDDSINGTYIKNEDEEVFITKDKIQIKGSGMISLGVPFDHAQSDVIHYFIG